jgi:hypothetical protein
MFKKILNQPTNLICVSLLISTAAIAAPLSPSEQKAWDRSVIKTLGTCFSKQHVTKMYSADKLIQKLVYIEAHDNLPNANQKYYSDKALLDKQPTKSQAKDLIKYVSEFRFCFKAPDIGEIGSYGAARAWTMVNNYDNLIKDIESRKYTYRDYLGRAARLAPYLPETVGWFVDSITQNQENANKMQALIKIAQQDEVNSISQEAEWEMEGYYVSYK